MSGSAKSTQSLLSKRNIVSPVPQAPNYYRDPSNVSANDVKFNKLLENNNDVTEETYYQVQIENETLGRKAQRSELASKNACLTRRWQTALTIGIVVTALAAGIGE